MGDVAEKYGYHLSTAFNRAFQSIHGVVPSAVKNEEMNYRIEKKDAFRIIGVPQPLDNEYQSIYSGKSR